MGERYSNKRLRFRGAGGKFRRPTLEDIGHMCCEKCGAIETIRVEQTGPFIDPREYNRAQRFCWSCRTGEPRPDVTMRAIGHDGGSQEGGERDG